MALGDNAAAIAVVLRLRDETEAGITSAEKRLQNMGRRFQTAGTIASAAISAPLAVLGKNAIEAASDTEESLNKVRVVFGDTAPDIEAFTASAATSLGTSRQQALETAGTFGNLFTALGLGQEEAADMSQEILTLGADLASFNNIDPTIALDKLRAGLVGEAEPLRQLGVNITEVAVQAKAMELGLGEAGRELTSQEKVQARYALIVEQTTNAQGDFARTSDALANSSRIAKATFEDVSAELGRELLPIALQVVTGVRGLLEGFKGLSPEVKTAIVVVGGLAFAIGPLLLVFGTVLTMLPAIGVALAVLLGPVGLIIAAIALLAVAWANDWGGIQGKTKVAIDFIGQVFGGFIRFVANWGLGLIGIVKGAINGVVTILNTLIDAWNFVAEKLGLPILGRIEVTVPMLDAVERELQNLARPRTAVISVATAVGAAGGVGINPGNAIAAAHGFEGMVGPGFGGPKLILAGEGTRAEHVSVTPVGRASAGGGGGGNTLISGNTFIIREEADIRRVAVQLEELRREESRRRGFSMGLSAA